MYERGSELFLFLQFRGSCGTGCLFEISGCKVPFLSPVMLDVRLKNNGQAGCHSSFLR